MKTIWIALVFFFCCNFALAVSRPYFKNELKIGYYNRGFIDVEFPRPPDPIFWEATTKMVNGIQLVYQRLVYTNGGRFGILIGGAVSRYESLTKHYTYVEAVYPILRYWFLRTPSVDFYFDYSVAGPAILSRRVIAEWSPEHRLQGADMGGYLIFQDYMGLGMTVGKQHAFSLDVRIVHYSNGDIFPRNSGFDVPFVIYAGYSF